MAWVLGFQKVGCGMMIVYRYISLLLHRTTHCICNLSADLVSPRFPKLPPALWSIGLIKSGIGPGFELLSLSPVGYLMKTRTGDPLTMTRIQQQDIQAQQERQAYCTSWIPAGHITLYNLQTLSYY